MTINEIAKLAGVSRATVSRYLNDGYVSDEKRERIKKVIKETGYVPSAQAQTMRTKKTRVIGVIIPRLNSDSIGGMVNGISSVLSAEGYQLILANTANNENEELKYLNTFKDNFVDGIILIGTIFTDRHKEILKSIKLPTVILGQRLESSPSVYSDDLGGMKALTNLMLKKKKKIGFIGVSEKDKAAGLDRKNGYIAALKENGIEYCDKYTVKCKFSAEEGYEACKKLLKNADDLEGIVCATDNIAAGAVKYIKEKGLKIPEDIIVAGVGDSVLGSVMEPKLTTLHLFYKSSGIEAANLLMKMINKAGIKADKIKMGYTIVERESTGI